MRDLDFPVQSRISAPLLVHSVPPAIIPWSPPLSVLSHPQIRAAVALGVGGSPTSHVLRSRVDDAPSTSHWADRAADPVLESPARETERSCRRQRAPAARKPGFCRRRIGEGGFHGPTSFLTLEEGALGLFFLRRKKKTPGTQTATSLVPLLRHVG